MVSRECPSDHLRVGTATTYSRPACFQHESGDSDRHNLISLGK